MSDEHRKCGALLRAILAVLFIFGFSAGATTAVEAHSAIHATAHKHHHRHKRPSSSYRSHVDRYQGERFDGANNRIGSPGFTLSIFGRDIWFGSHIEGASSSIFGVGIGTPFGNGSIALPSDRSHAIALIKANAEAYGVPVSLALAIGHFESGFNMRMRGKAGERGALQVLPATARHLGVQGDLYGPAGIKAGVLYLREALALQSRYGLCAAVSAFNHGIGYVRCTSYGKVILALAHGAPTLRAAVWQAHWIAPSVRTHKIRAAL